MSRPALKVVAAILITLIIAVGINALDHLPGAVRSQIDSERAALASAQNQIHAAQDAVARETQADTAFFGGIPASREWPGQFQQAAGSLQSAARDMDELSRLEQHGHYRDRDHAVHLLSDERGLRTAALARASAIQTEAAHWIARKQQLPSELQQMERDYQAIHNYDLAPLTATIQRAENDWPQKKDDLESRLAAVRGSLTRADQLWQSTADARQDAAAGGAAPAGSAALLTAADELKASAAALPKQSADLQALAGQLYDSWDRILVDMETRGFGSSRLYDQKIRTVRTHQGVTTSNEQWVPVSEATYNAMHNDLGMAIEQKPAGKYDSEADHVAQPAGFAYVASPAQGSNQYGYWEHRNGQSFWVFYGQYALLRDLLFNRSYRPLDRGEWEDYRAERSRGNTYYGHDAENGANAPKYGTNGTATQDRYSGSTYARSGGFRNSPYASRSGSYRDSPYASPNARSRESQEPKVFGGHSRESEPHAAPPEHSYRPAPRSSPRPSPRGSGRRFGRR